MLAIYCGHRREEADVLIIMIPLAVGDRCWWVGGGWQRQSKIANSVVVANSVADSVVVPVADSVTN